MQAEIGQEIMNDKFLKKSLHWAKKSFVPGADRSNMPREDNMEVDNISSISSTYNIKAASMVKPGSSGTAVKDTPGKDMFKPVINIILQGQEHAGGGGHVQEEGLGEGHVLQGVAGHLLPEGVLDSEQPQYVDSQGQGVAQEGQEGGGGEERRGCEHLQHQQVGQDKLDCDQLGGGGEVHDQQQQGGDVRSRNSHFLRLRYPDDNASPKYVKSRRKKRTDGLVQARLNFVKTQKEENCPSNRALFCPSGGPQVMKKSERGTKRGLGDQMEGPASKKIRD